MRQFRYVLLTFCTFAVCSMTLLVPAASSEESTIQTHSRVSIEPGQCLDWQLRDIGEAFSVLVPSPHETRTGKIQARETTIQTEYLRSRSITCPEYNVVYSSYMGKFSSEEKRLQGMMSNYVSRYGGTIVVQHRISMSCGMSEEIMIESSLPGMFHRVRVAELGNAEIEISLQGSRDEVSSGEADQFFGSLEVISSNCNPVR